MLAKSSTPTSAPLRGDVFSDKCRSRQILKHVTNRWGGLVLFALAEKTYRFNELRRRIAGVSEKMLAQTLQSLEQDGFVERTAHPVIPPHVDYRLTALGEELVPHISRLICWIEDNLGVIEQHQQLDKNRESSTL